MSQVKGELQIKGVSVTITCEQPIDFVQVIDRLTNTRKEEVINATGGATTKPKVRPARRFSRSVSWTDRDLLIVAACAKANMKTHGIGPKVVRALSDGGDYRSRNQSSAEQMASKIRQYLRGDVRIHRDMSHKASKVLEANGYSFGSQAHMFNQSQKAPELA